MTMHKAVTTAAFGLPREYGTMPFHAIGSKAGTPRALVRGLAPDPIAAHAAARAIEAAGLCSAQQRIAPAAAEPAAGEILVGFDDETLAVHPAVPLFGDDQAWPYEFHLIGGTLACFAPQRTAARPAAEKTCLRQVGEALRSDAAIADRQAHGIELCFRSSIGWLPQQPLLFVKFGVWRRDTDEAIAIGDVASTAVVAALLRRVPLHRKTGVISIGAFRRITVAR